MAHTAQLSDQGDQLCFDSLQIQNLSINPKLTLYIGSESLVTPQTCLKADHLRRPEAVPDLLHLLAAANKACVRYEGSMLAPRVSLTANPSVIPRGLAKDLAVALA